MDSILGLFDKDLDKVKNVLNQTQDHVKKYLQVMLIVDLYVRRNERAEDCMKEICKIVLGDKK